MPGDAANREAILVGASTLVPLGRNFAESSSSYTLKAFFALGHAPAIRCNLIVTGRREVLQ